MRGLIMACVMALVLAACDRQPAAAPSSKQPPDRVPDSTPIPDMPVLGKLKIVGEGEIYFDGQKMSIEELSTALAKLKGKQGLILFRREKAAQPSPAALDVVKKVIKILVANGLASRPAQEEF